MAHDTTPRTAEYYARQQAQARAASRAAAGIVATQLACRYCHRRRSTYGSFQALTGVCDQRPTYGPHFYEEAH
jgi:hypothetical protein